MLLIFLAYLAPSFNWNFGFLMDAKSKILEYSKGFIKSSSLEINVLAKSEHILKELQALVSFTQKPCETLENKNSDNLNLLCESKIKNKFCEINTEEKGEFRGFQGYNKSSLFIKIRKSIQLKICSQEKNERNFFVKKLIKGSKEYYSPEVIRNGNYSFSSDYWALGCTIYDLYEGVTLFWEDSADSLNNTILEKILNFNSNQFLSNSISQEAIIVFKQLLNFDSKRRIPDFNLKSLFKSPWLKEIDPNKIRKLPNPLIPKLKKSIFTKNTLYYQKITYTQNPKFILNHFHNVQKKFNLKNLFKNLKDNEIEEIDIKKEKKEPLYAKSLLLTNKNNNNMKSQSTNLILKGSKKSLKRQKTLNTTNSLRSPNSIFSREVLLNFFNEKTENCFTENINLKKIRLNKIRTKEQNKIKNYKPCKTFENLNLNGIFLTHEDIKNKLKKQEFMNKQNKINKEMVVLKKNLKKKILESSVPAIQNFRNASCIKDKIPLLSERFVNNENEFKSKSIGVVKIKKKTKFNKKIRLSLKDNKDSRRNLNQNQSKTKKNRKTTRGRRKKKKKIHINNETVRQTLRNLKKKWNVLINPKREKQKNKIVRRGKSNDWRHSKNSLSLSRKIIGEVGNRKHNRRLQGSINWFQKKISQRKRKLFGYYLER
jgi:hypothetical protein